LQKKFLMPLKMSLGGKNDNPKARSDERERLKEIGSGL
jgi:hypothetical protein